MDEWFGTSWQTAGFTALGTMAIYATTLLAVRVAGRRTLAQMSGFDIVVTIALGSLLATTAVSRDVSYLRGAVALVTLLSLQVVVAALRRRFTVLERILEFQPEVVAERGEVRLPRSPFGAQLNENELFSMLRKKGVFDLSEVRVVVLEPTGGVSIGTDEIDPSAAIVDRLRGEGKHQL